MGKGTVLLLTMAMTCTALADGLPGITSQPQSQMVGGPFGTTAASFTVTATNATGFQWRFNGVNIPGATNATLQITNAQPTNSGYYLALATNISGWVPSQLAYLSVVNSGSYVPLSNLTNTGFYAQARDLGDNPINNAYAEVLAGPTLDQMAPTGDFASVSNGYFSLEQDTGFTSTFVGNVDPGQTLYYRVAITPDFTTVTQVSRVLKLTAGDGGTFPIPSTGNLQFISPIGWPNDPYPIDPSLLVSNNPVAVLGANHGMGTVFFDDYYIEYGLPTWQWRKDGVPIGSPQLFSIFQPQNDEARAIPVLSITNAQLADAGVYDIIFLGENWFIYPLENMSVQIVDSAVFFSPQLEAQLSGGFVFDTQLRLEGTPGHVFQIQSSPDLSTWSNLMLVTNINGNVSLDFSQPVNPNGAQFYRAMILPP